jgi:hypothetical protein
VVDLHTTLGQQLLDVPVGEAEAQIPAHGQHMTSGGKQKPAKAEGVSGME